MERQALINNLIIDIDKRKNIYYKQMCKLKKINSSIEVTESTLNVASTSCLVIGLTHINPILLGVGTGVGLIATLIGAISKVMKLQQKYENNKTTYLNLNNLSREIKIIVCRNHLTNEERQALLVDISNKLSLIDDSAPVLTSYSKII